MRIFKSLCVNDVRGHVIFLTGCVSDVEVMSLI